MTLVSVLPMCYLNKLSYLILLNVKMPTIRQVWLLIKQGDFAFSVDLNDAYLYILIVKHHHCFLWFVWQHTPYQWKVLPFGLATACRIFTHSLNPYCSFVITRVCVLYFTCIISWFFITPSMLAKELKLSCAHFWFILDYIVIYLSLKSVSHISFLPWVFVGIQ